MRVSKQNSNLEKQVIILMISNRKKREAKSARCEAKLSPNDVNGIILQ